MFLTKFFKRLSGTIEIKWQLVVVELCIVFFGVYLAFLLNSHQQEQYVKQEGEKVWSSLKLELEAIRFSFPIWVEYQKSQNEKWDSLFANQEVGKFYTWRYIQPQYDFTTIEYALSTRESSIVDFDMYKKLTELNQNIQMLRHSEELMTETGFKYKNIHSKLPKTSKEYLQLTADNRLYFFKFIDFSKIRVNIMNRIVLSVIDQLEIIDEKLGPEKSLELEKSFIQKQIIVLADNATPEEILARIKEVFPDLSDQQIKNIYDAAHKEIAASSD